MFCLVNHHLFIWHILKCSPVPNGLLQTYYFNTKVHYFAFISIVWPPDKEPSTRKYNTTTLQDRWIRYT